MCDLAGLSLCAKLMSSGKHVELTLSVFQQTNTRLAPAAILGFCVFVIAGGVNIFIIVLLQTCLEHEASRL